jgi:hypothetical protein
LYLKLFSATVNSAPTLLQLVAKIPRRVNHR